MSNMFMGTLTIKGPKTSTAMGMSLEEMDRPVRIVMVIVMLMMTMLIMKMMTTKMTMAAALQVHCPENIDRSSWGVMCKLRREKIRMEEDLRSLAKEVAEAEVINFLAFSFWQRISYLGDCGATRGEPRHR